MLVFNILEDWLNLLNECLSYEIPSVRTAAIDALPSFFNEYYKQSKQEGYENTIVRNYVEQLKEHNKIIRMGHVLALGIALFTFLFNQSIVFFLSKCMIFRGNASIYVSK